MRVQPEDEPKFERGWRFWMIFFCIALCTFLTALELSAVSTALPTIVSALHGDQFVWVGSAYTLATTAFVPLSGGLAETFGRRSIMFGAVVIFGVGSALCGAAKSLNFLIAGRTVQGVGGGGIASLSQIILSDMVPLKQRGAYTGIIAMTFTIASGIGPVIGGVLAQKGQWRWLFYLNLPICGIAAVLVLIFVTLRTPPGTFAEKLKKIDWIGNALVVASTTSTMIGLTWGGVEYKWTSYHILVPLILGLAGLVGFLLYEAFVAKNPLVPFHLFSTRTALSGYLQTFFIFTVLQCILYYLPVFFQACKNADPIASGVDVFGLAFSLAPFTLLTGMSVTVTHRYRPQLWVAWCMVMVGSGLFTTLNYDSSRIRAIGFQILAGSFIGMVCGAVFFPILSPTPVQYNAHANALYTFFRNFANILGITVGGTIFQNELGTNLPAEFLQRFPQGLASAYAAIPVIPTLQEPLKAEVQMAFGKSLKPVWQFTIGIGGAGLLVSLLMKHVPLRGEVDKKWAMEAKQVDEESVEMKP
ncbi:iron permease [Neolentinus lepideus HHB14362 ss-1]|uniref:Iron permease n=1 Tax=Neolentinus lepideus HHB14362 ss-1 TaxID=1314782 RepID=A0A165QXZ5_9AGAM|nr:iron permease [Neolentinus lepideus HHB14362 ss-1]